MASPGMTSNAAGNVLASQTIAAGGSVTSSTYDLSAKFEGQLQAGCTFGTISTVAGLQVDIYRMVGSTPVQDTQPATSVVLPAVAGARAVSIALATGKYKIKFTNLDATNSVTLAYGTADTIDGVS